MTERFADEELARWVAAVRAEPPEGPSLDLARLRAPRQRAPGPAVEQVRDLILPVEPPLPARLYRPSSEPLPLVLYVHGGGSVSGDLDSHDRTCRRLASLAEAAVLALKIRLAPEHPAPAAINDVIAALGWSSSDAGSPALAGDSSGALTAVMAAVALSRAGTPPGALFLACPNADLTLALPSVEEKGTGSALRRRRRAGA